MVIMNLRFQKGLKYIFSYSVFDADSEYICLVASFFGPNIGHFAPRSLTLIEGVNSDIDSSKN